MKRIDLATDDEAPSAGDAVSIRASATSLADFTVAELRNGFRRCVFTPSEVLEAVFKRIQGDDADNAYHAVTADRARKEAAASDARWRGGAPAGPLDGVAVSIKENLHRKGISVPGGRAMTSPPVAEVNCPIVDRLEESGALIVGSTVMPDMGMISSGVSSRHGITPNAWNRSWTAGGSSAGAGVAAAAGHGPVHLGSDIGGSVRLPATWSGLASLKPSHGLVPLDAPYQGRAAGPLARWVDDLYAAMAVIARFDSRDTCAQPYPPIDWTPRILDPAGLVIGLQLDGGPGLPVDPEVRAAVSAAATVFADAGAHIVEAPAIATEELITRIDRFWRARAWGQYRRLSNAEQREEVLPYIARWASGAATVDAATAVGDYEAFLDLGARARALTQECDLVLSPVTPVLAFPAEWPMPTNDPDAPMSHISFTVPFNMSGQPSGTVNAGRSTDGRWIGLQVTGQIGQDAQVLGAMRWWETVRSSEATPSWEQISR
ncbi:amidase [Nesterenkonia sp. CL21]|uniref:amidase n=1 Tax=Nesterenkonia sp. CL21 TaxID=3064894 RepID=UPI002878B554|nr:amidase [Nesterenkonia sp. CL21]MDS2172394.1 amidase [Nesterenkonia sp. CL21]